MSRLALLPAALLPAALAVLDANLAHAQTADDDAYVKAVTTISVLGQMAGMTKDWCDARAPEGAAQHAQALAQWRARFGMDAIDARLADLNGGSTDAADSSSVHASLDGQFPDPAAFCGDFGASLDGLLNPETSYPGEYALAANPPAVTDTMPEEETGGEAGTGGDVAIGDWGRLDTADVAAVMQELGGQPPFRLGGPLRHGSYSCQQVRYFGSSGPGSTLTYTLSLYDDEGLRIDGETWDSNDGTKPSAMGDYIGTYAYDETIGAIEVGAWDYDNYDIQDFAMFEGEYADIDDGILIIAFRQVQDAQGQAFLYGIQQYGGSPEASRTRCAHAGEPAQPSPVAAARVERLEAEAERYRFRTAPGGGLGMDRIAGFLYYSDYAYGVMTGGHMEEDSDLLLTDGWGYSVPDFTPHDLDAEASKRGEPIHWFRWKQEGGRIQTTADGATWKDADALMGRPVKPGELFGAFKHMTVIGDGIDMEPVINEATWSFDGGSSFSYTTSRRAAGFYDYVTSKGTYTLEGYTLALTYEDGSIWRAYVFTFGDGHNIIVNGQTYTRE